MFSYLRPSTTCAILVGLHCLPASSLGLLCKFCIVVYLVLMFIGYLFSSRGLSNRLPLHPSRSSYALVTGASTGIGAQLCRQLARRDFNLIMVARSRAKLNALAGELQQANSQIKIHVLTQDLTEPSAVENLVRRIDALDDVQIDIIINNAGCGSTKVFLETPLENTVFEQMIALHVTAPTQLIRHYLPKMLDRPSRIVNISSVISYVSSPRAAMYASTKAFLSRLTTALDYEVQQMNSNPNVSFLLVTPGPTLQTEFDQHDESIVFRLPWVTLTSQQVAQQTIDACLRGDRNCISGWANRLTVWFMTTVHPDFAHLVCWVLWASWPEVKQWLYERRHLVIICANLLFLLAILACFFLVKTMQQFYYRFFWSIALLTILDGENNRKSEEESERHSTNGTRRW